MGQVLHGSATTTEAVRRAIHNSQESLRALSKRYGINQKTVAKWRKRTSVADLPTGPKEPHSTVLSAQEEAMIVAFRRHTLLPLDDCLYALQGYGPHKTLNNRFRRWREMGVFERIFSYLAAEDGLPDTLMIDATHLKAHRMASSLLKGGFFPAMPGAQKVG